jgi:hypothetical protein
LVTAPTNTPASFSLVSAPVITGPFQPVTAAVVTQPEPFVFKFTAPVNGPIQFYEILGP